MAELLRFFEPTAGNYFLFGPRGTGKSTWLKRQYPRSAWIDLLDPESYRSYLAYPERLREFVRAAQKKTPVVIDEVHRVPQLLPVVHQLIEENRSLRFVLTGSSARQLRRAGVDLLGGRASMRSMHPFMAAEMGDAFDLETSLGQGMVPLVRMSPDPAVTLRGYVDLYVQQEVKAEGLVRRLDDFGRFLEVISFSQAQPLNVASVARECVSSRNTVESFVTILEDLLLAVRLPVFARRAGRATAAHPKLFFFDCGVFRSLRPRGPLDSVGEVAGPTLEGLVFQHLRAWSEYRDTGFRLYYWRTQAGSEVDLVLYGGEGFFAIEVKNTQVIRPQDLHGLKAFRADYPEARALLLYRGREALERDGILVLPVDDFLRQLTPKEPFPTG